MKLKYVEVYWGGHRFAHTTLPDGTAVKLPADLGRIDPPSEVSRIDWFRLRQEQAGLPTNPA